MSSTTSVAVTPAMAGCWSDSVTSGSETNCSKAARRQSAAQQTAKQASSPSPAASEASTRTLPTYMLQRDVDVGDNALLELGGKQPRVTVRHDHVVELVGLPKHLPSNPPSARPAITRACKHSGHYHAMRTRKPSTTTNLSAPWTGGKPCSTLRAMPCMCLMLRSQAVDTGIMRGSTPQAEGR